MTPEQRQRAGKAIAERIEQMSATPATVAHAAGIHAKTLRAIIRGERWPTDAVQSHIEAVLRWHEGEIAVRAVQGGIDGALDALTEVELASELLRRLNERAARGSRLRSTDQRVREI